MSIERKKKPQYGENYESHCLEIYKLFVEMADRISQRRQAANSFFLSINTAVIGAVSYVGFGEKANLDPAFYVMVAVAGLVLCFLWFSLILSYKSMNTHKFIVIHQIEQSLPLAPYDEEWEVAGKGKDWTRHIPFTRIEMFIPCVFFILHLAVLVQGKWR